jgi:hypothetical protein
MLTIVTNDNIAVKCRSAQHGHGHEAEEPDDDAPHGSSCVTLGPNGSMKAFVGITDWDWFDLLRRQSGLDEVNFWQPSGSRSFRALRPGELFLFKLHSPRNAGGGVFAHATRLPISLAGESFESANGATSLDEMRRRLECYRRQDGDRFADCTIGCILLEEPFFLAEERWLPVPPDWRQNIVQGRTYDLEVEPGRTLWQQLQNAPISADTMVFREAPPEEAPPLRLLGRVLRERVRQDHGTRIDLEAAPRERLPDRRRQDPALELELPREGPHVEEVPHPAVEESPPDHRVELLGGHALSRIPQEPWSRQVEEPHASVGAGERVHALSGAVAAAAWGRARGGREVGDVEDASAKLRRGPAIPPAVRGSGAGAPPPLRARRDRAAGRSTARAAPR